MTPAAFQARLQQAVQHHLGGRLDEASRVYEALRIAAPRDFQVNHLLGTLRYQQGRAAEAAQLLETALRLQPCSAATLMCLGLAYVALQRRPEAEKALRESVRLNPKSHEAWGHLGATIMFAGKTAEAIECLRRCVALKPDFADGWHSLGCALQITAQGEEAVACHNRALALQPDHPRALFSRAQALHIQHRLTEAIADFDAHLARHPGHHEARSFRLLLLNYRDDLSPEALFAEHLAYGRAVEANIPAERLRPQPRQPKPAGTPLRVAFLSPDLRTHSVAFFLEPLLAHLDPTRFTVILYHDHFTEDAMSERLRKHAQVWRNFVGLDRERVLKAIAEDAPDILIDLTGHTGFNRMEMLARRLAPVQIAYLGYPNTTGLSAMDYRLTDALADPVGAADQLHTEKLLRFAPTAWCFSPPADAPAPAPTPCLSQGRIAFGSFNTLSKVSDHTLRLWRDLLAAVPDSQLVLKSMGLDPKRWTERLAAAGLPVDRVRLLAPTKGIAEHLACYGQIDIALDPFPYHGTTTTCEALWMGVPVVTRAGDRHASRVGVSLLHAVGHPEWVASDDADYVARAVALATDHARLAALRAGLRAEMQRSPLLDYAGQAARFGDALEQAWANTPAA